MHDGIYCMHSVHWLHARFHGAFWDTFSALYSGQLLLTKHWDTTTKWHAPYVVHCAGRRGQFSDTVTVYKVAVHYEDKFEIVDNRFCQY